MRYHILVTGLILLTCVTSAHARNQCKPCNELRCKDGKDCEIVPLVACPPVRVCVGTVVKDECGCCDECMSTIGQKCDNVGNDSEVKRCAPGLKCVPGESGPYQVGIGAMPIRRCEKDADLCSDPVKKKSYRRGEIWVQDVFACNVCTCGAGGRMKCSSMQCNNMTCADSKHVEDRCCSFCKQEDWEKGCEFNKATYFDGEMIVLQDHRSICTCHNRRWSCTVDPTHGFRQLSEKPACYDDA
ncbi:BMP-binding endothelial regulator protein [Nematostella vectensis]|uniref:BMP-binding endothelial regulator protein n=1 Tax=Nematostella vectensis TaxID=45351 RepID=UPI00139034B5|nr:BMP-binding endothelial regulator protein [Nematostella vectensis]XP_048585399.1 BMP-binding endothelial regulator protein [Nematostella vectensis]